jgi:putative ABC transport system permease protein
MGWIGLSLRRLRDERASAAAFALLVLVTATLASAAPRALDRLADDTLRADVTAGPVAPRSIQLIQEDRTIPGEGDALGPIHAIGDQLHATIPVQIQSLIADRAVVVDSARWSVTRKLNDPTTLKLRIQPGAEDRLHLTAGRMPGPLSPKSSTHAVEVAIAASSAKVLGAGIGDTIDLAVDGSDPLSGRLRDAIAGATIVGLFTVDDPTDPWWLGDRGLAGPITRQLAADAIIIDTMALVSPNEYEELLDTTAGNAEAGLPAPVRITYREYVDPGRIRESNLPSIVSAFRKLEALYPDANVRRTGVVGNSQTAMRTGLRALLESHEGRWAAALRILAVAAVGPIAVAVAALGLAAVFAARRRRASLSLARGRGASMPQVTVAVLAEGLLLAGPAAIVGALLSVALVPGDPPRGAIAIGLATAVLAIGILVAATVPGVRVAGLGGGRGAVRATRPTPRRLVFEAFVVILSVIGTVLLRQRGIAASSAAGTLPTADPLAAAVPALAGLAAGLVAVRLLPILIAPFGRLVRRSRGLVPLLALRRAAAGGTASILLVLLATSSIGAFSAAALVHLERAADAVAYETVGADYQVSRSDNPLTAHFDFKSLPGVEAAATLFRGRAAIATHGAYPDVGVLDVSDYELVVAGTPEAGALPSELFGPAVEPLPIIVSDELASHTGGVQVGEVVSLTIQGYSFKAKAVASRASFPGMADTSLFILVNRDQVRALFPAAPLLPSVAFLRAPPGAAADLHAAVAKAMPPATFTGRAELSDRLRDTPVVGAIRLGIAVAAAVAALYAALAVAAALGLAGSARAIELAHLRTLGLADGQASGVLLAEHAPAIALAFAGGLALGIGLFVVLVPGLGLDALVGASTDLPPPVDAGLLAITAAGVAAVVALGLGLGILSGRSASPVSALRRGFE